MGRFAYRDIQPKTLETAALDEGVFTIGLEGLDWISQLNLNCAVISTDAGDMGTPVWEVLHKVEVLGNGSSVIKSYSGSELRAIAAYSGISMTTMGNYCRHGTDDKSFHVFPILFGRFPGDTKYMLNTNAWDTIQLRGHWKADDLTFNGTVYDLTASPEWRYAADALVYENGSPPGVGGYIKTSRVDEWVPAVNTRHPTEIPRGYPLRGIISSQSYTDLQWFNFYAKTKLDFDNGSWVPIDATYRQLQSMYNMWWPQPFDMSIYADQGGSNDHDAGFGWITGFSGMVGNHRAVEASLGHAPTFGRTEFSNITVSETNSATEDPWMIWTQGMMPHHCLYFPMWKFADIGEDAIPTAKYKRIDFETTTDGTGTSGNCINLAEYIVPQGQT